MSDNASWYQRKMAQVRQQQAPYQVQPQQYAHQAPGNYVQPPQYPQQHQLPITQQVPEQPLPPGSVTIDNLYAAAGHWRGGQAHKVDQEPCPNCGSNQYFSRSTGSKRGPAPAPHCYNCGYNDGMFTQGEATTWGMTG